MCENLSTPYDFWLFPFLWFSFKGQFVSGLVIHMNLCVEETHFPYRIVTLHRRKMTPPPPLFVMSFY